jgi:predicted ATP-grasp superfamily ATP-dependent carboligase
VTTVLVTDAGRGSAVAFVRSLARAGHEVVAGDVRRISAGRWSRSATSSFLYPDPYLEPAAAADAVLSQVVEHHVDIVVPITDATTRVAESLRDRLPSGCLIATASAKAAAVAADKDRTVELAVELGIPVPVTRVVESASEARDASGAFGWPIVVKPVSSLAERDDGTMGKFDVGYAFDVDDLEHKVGSLGRGSPVLLQEFCGGDGIGVEVLADRGRVLRSFSHRRIHEVPVTGGASSLRESVPIDPVLLDHTTRLMAALDWTGLAMVEFKSGASGHRLMEINGRPWGSLPLAVRSGVDFPADYVELLTSGALSSDADQETYSIGTIARNLQLETVWIGSVLRGQGAVETVSPWPPRRSALAAAARLFSPRIGDDILSFRDPLASIAELLSVTAMLGGKMTSIGKQSDPHA